MYLEEKIKELSNVVLATLERVEKLETQMSLKAQLTYFTTNEAAQKLHMSRAAILDQIRKGKIIAVKTAPASKHSRYKISEAEINRIINLWL